MFALIVMVAPAARGQTLKNRPLTELKTRMLGGSEIGATVREVDEADVKREKLAASTGAVIDEVRTDSPAAKAGMKAGDVIVSFDGERVRSARQFARLVEETPDGREVDATIVRAGEKLNLKVAPVATSMFGGFEPFTDLRKRFGGRAETDNFGVLPKVSPKTDLYLRTFDSNRGLGVTVQDLTAQLGDYFGTRDGVLVSGVEEGSPAKAAGLRAGDVITKIDGNLVRSSEELRRRLAGASTEVSIAIVRDRKELVLKSSLK